MKKRFWVSLLAVSMSLFLISCVNDPEEGNLAADYYNLARDFHEMEQYGRAEYYYLASLDLDPGSQDSRYNLSLMYLNMGNADKALVQLKKLYDADESNLVTMNALGIAYSLKEEWDEALSWYGKVIDEFPWDETALYNGALIYTKREQPEESLAWLEKLWERDKSYQTAMALWERTSEKPAEERRAYLEEAETDEEEEILDLRRKRFDLYLIQEWNEDALELVQDLKTEDSEKEGWYWFKEGELLLGFYRTEEGLESIRESFRKGFNDSGELSSLAAKLAPSYREVLENMEELYFPE